MKNRKPLYNLGKQENQVTCCVCFMKDHKHDVFKLGWQELHSKGGMKWYCYDCVETQKDRR